MLKFMVFHYFTNPIRKNKPNIHPIIIPAKSPWDIPVSTIVTLLLESTAFSILYKKL